MHFEFASAARIIFGDGSAKQLPQLAREKGSHALLVTDSFLASGSIAADRYPARRRSTIDAISRQWRTDRGNDR